MCVCVCVCVCACTHVCVHARVCQRNVMSNEQKEPPSMTCTLSRPHFPSAFPSSSSGQAISEHRDKGVCAKAPATNCTRATHRARSTAETGPQDAIYVILMLTHSTLQVVTNVTGVTRPRPQTQRESH